MFDVAGAATLSGVLQLVFEPGFTPTANQTVLTATSVDVSGGLNLIDPSGLYTLQPSATGLPLSLAAGGPTGDYNGNGVVDAADYTMYRDNLGADSGVLQNNDIPGPIDVSHYSQWKNNFGAGAAGGASAVPEPGCLLLVMVGCIAFVVPRRRQAA